MPAEKVPRATFHCGLVDSLEQAIDACRPLCDACIEAAGMHEVAATHDMGGDGRTRCRLDPEGLMLDEDPSCTVCRLFKENTRAKGMNLRNRRRVTCDVREWEDEGGIDK